MIPVDEGPFVPAQNSNVIARRIPNLEVRGIGMVVQAKRGDELKSLKDNFQRKLYEDNRVSKNVMWTHNSSISCFDRMSERNKRVVGEIEDD